MRDSVSYIGVAAWASLCTQLHAHARVRVEILHKDDGLVLLVIVMDVFWKLVKGLTPGSHRKWKRPEVQPRFWFLRWLLCAPFNVGGSGVNPDGLHSPSPSTPHPPPLSFSLCLSACVLVVDGQMGKFHHVGEKFGEIETPGEQQENLRYGQYSVKQSVNTQVSVLQFTVWIRKNFNLWTIKLNLFNSKI